MGTQAPTPSPTPDPTPAPPPPPTPAPGLFGYLTTKGTSCCGTLQTSATETAMCRCTDGSRSVSVCASNSRCGNPKWQGKDVPGSHNKELGCTNSQRACNGSGSSGRVCTVTPSVRSYDFFTYEDCLEECGRLNMHIPMDTTEVNLATNTGCNINGEKMWICRSGASHYPTCNKNAYTSFSKSPASDS